MPTEPQKKGPTKTQRRLEERIKKYEGMTKGSGGGHLQRPGSLNGRKKGGK